jgi:hypothetical protein
MVIFQSPAHELAETQLATEELLHEVAAAAAPPSEHTLSRLDKLASACARLAYTNSLAAPLSDDVHNLIVWCDHLDDPQWKAQFVAALKSYPLRSPR